MQEAQENPATPTADQAQRARVTAGQRKINLIWEYTQAFIAIMLVVAAVVAALRVTFDDKPRDIPTILSTLVGMVVGSYFQRTNHMNIGGIGKKATDEDEFKGR